MPGKRPVDDGDDAGAQQQAPAKVPRNELHVEYDAQQGQSAGARKKGASNRTGQACDRCKVRIFHLHLVDTALRDCALRPSASD